MKGCRWQFLPLAPPEQFDKMAGIPRLLAQVLYNRHILDLAGAEAFLSGDQRLESDPRLLPDIDKAVSRIRHALARGEKVAVYGDFDVDGVAATAVLVQGLSALNGNAVPYIPHRFDEGYGLNRRALEALAQQGVTLVITVDCGTGARAEVEFARDLGLDVIVTDHHSVPARLPPAVAIVNPRLGGPDNPCRHLAGSGVAFKLLQALCRELGQDTDLDYCLDLVALGTVADVVPLVEDNRYLVKRGLEVLNRAPRPGITELMLRSGPGPCAIDAYRIAWVLAPRLNAAGRLEHAMASYDLLTTYSPEQALELAARLEENNARRQSLTQQVLESARRQVMAAGIQEPLLVASGEDYAPGVVGIVANRLVDEFYRPAMVLALGADTSRGSARSIPEFDIIAALRQCTDLLMQFGGHPAAAGFTVKSDKLQELQDRLRGLARDGLSGLELRPLLQIDARVKLSSLRGDTVKLLQRLEPLGHGNPAPVFFTRGADILDCRTLGRDGEHLRLKLRGDSVIWDAMGFGLGRRQEQLARRMDVVYSLEVDRRADRGTLRLNILDMAPSSRQAG